MKENKTTSFITQIILTKNNLLTTNGESSTHLFNEIINEGVTCGRLIPWNGKTTEQMKKTPGVYKKYAGQKLSGFKLRLIEDEIFVLIKRFNHSEYKYIGKVDKKNFDQIKMCLNNCSSYEGTAYIIGGSRRITTREETHLYNNGDYEIDIKVTFYFKKKDPNSNFKFPERFNLQPISDINDYVVFDLEMLRGSGLKTEIIEIGAIKYRNNKEMGRFQTYVKPTQRIPRIIQELTGINDDLVSDAESIETILPIFLKFIGDYPLIGHDVANHDIRLIKKEMARLNLGFLSNQSLDTLTMARELYDTPSHKLEYLKDYLGINIRSHEAVNDCIVSNRIFQDYKAATILNNMTIQIDVINEKKESN